MLAFMNRMESVEEEKSPVEIGDTGRTHREK
jgi:hypothetical protein